MVAHRGMAHPASTLLVTHMTHTLFAATVLICGNIFAKSEEPTKERLTLLRAAETHWRTPEVLATGIL